VSVDRQGRDAEVGAVHRLADLRVASRFHQLGAPRRVGRVGTGRDRERRVVAPLRGIADLRIERRDILGRGLLRRIAHQSRVTDLLFQREEKVLDELVGALLRLGRKVLLHVDLAEGHSHRGVRRGHAALPARLVLGRPGERLAVEVEVFVHELFRKRGRRGCEEVPAQIGLPERERLGLQEAVRGLENIGLPDV
jgi:hypothetical protein